jgi:hypothetical protein
MTVAAWQRDMFGDGQPFRTSWDRIIEQAVESVGGFKAQTDAEKNEENRRILARVVVGPPWVVAAFEKAVEAGDPQVGIKALCDILRRRETLPRHRHPGPLHPQTSGEQRGRGRNAALPEVWRFSRCLSRCRARGQGQAQAHGLYVERLL